MSMILGSSLILKTAVRCSTTPYKNKIVKARRSVSGALIILFYGVNSYVDKKNGFNLVKIFTRASSNPERICLLMFA